MSRELMNPITGELIQARDIPTDLQILDIYSASGVADEEPRIDALATVSAGYREAGKDGHAGLPKVSRDGQIYLHDPKGRAPGLKAALAANGNKALTVAFPFNNPAAFVQQTFREYSSTALLAYGDQNGIKVIEKAGHRFIEAGTDEYEAVKRRCKVALSVYFALAEWSSDGPRVVFPDGLGLYRIRSTSRNTLRNLKAAIKGVGDYTGGRIAGVPFDVALDYRDVAGPDGSRRNVPCFTFVMRPPVPLTSRTFVPQLTQALHEGQLLQLPPPSEETLDYAIWEGVPEDDPIMVEQITEDDARLISAGGRCDPRDAEARWFALVDGTFLDNDDSRAKFMLGHTGELHASLAAFLEGATEGEVALLLESAGRQIEAAKLLSIQQRAGLGERSALSVLNDDPDPGQERLARMRESLAEKPGNFTPPPGEAPTEPRRIMKADVLDAYRARYLQAESLGLKMDGFELPSNATVEQIVAMGKALVEEIQKAQPAVGLFS